MELGGDKNFEVKDRVEQTHSRNMYMTDITGKDL